MQFYPYSLGVHVQLGIEKVPHPKSNNIPKVDGSVCDLFIYIYTNSDIISHIIIDIIDTASI